MDDQALARRRAIDQSTVRSELVEAVVDTGAAISVLPQALAERLGLAMRSSDYVALADGIPRELPVTDAVEFVFMGRDAVERCVVLGDEVLLGQLFLEQTDLFVDSVNRRLVGNPDHPDQRVRKVRRLAPISA
jgi:clan AA aspartic protease